MQIQSLALGARTCGSSDIMTAMVLDLFSARSTCCCSAAGKRSFSVRWSSLVSRDAALPFKDCDDFRRDSLNAFRRQCRDAVRQERRVSCYTPAIHPVPDW